MVVTAVNQLIDNEMRMTENKERVYSPVESWDVPMAANAAIATAVALRRGIAVCPTTSLAAEIGSSP